MKDYTFDKISREKFIKNLKNILKENKEIIERENYIDIEKSLFELIGGNRNEE